MSKKIPDIESLSEITRLKIIEQELKARLRQQATVASLGQLALASADLIEFMQEATRMVAHTLEVEFCKILELLPEKGELLLRAGVGWKEGMVGHARIPAGPESLAGFTLISSEPIIVTDLRQETHFSDPPLLQDHGVISGMSVKIPGKERPYGVLGVHTQQPRIYTKDDTLFLLGVANLLASAIERHRSDDALRSSRDQLEIILHGVADGITAQGPGGSLIYANHAAARSVGFASVKEFLETPLTEIWKEFETRDEFGNLFPQDQLPGRLALQGVQSPPATVSFRVLSTGEERWSVVKATPVINQAGKVELVVNIFQDVTELKRIEQSQRLLAEAGNLLSASLDYTNTLSSVAELAIKGFSDWCVIHVIDDDGSIQQVAVAHVDPLKVELANDFHRRHPPNLDAASGVGNVLRTGKSEFYPEISDAALEAGARDAQHLELLRSLGLNSVIIAPLIARGRILGAITLVWSETRRRYTAADVVLAEELARRAAFAIDNSRLYREAQTLNTELEHRVTRRTAQLQTIVTKLKNEISERKRVEDALRKNERMLHALFESAPDAVLLIDSEGKITRLNDQAEAMFGYSEEKIIGKPVEVLLPDRFHSRHIIHRSAYLAKPRTRPMGIGLELFGKRNDGEEFPIDIMLSPVQTEEGRLVICAVRDITERKQMQAELSEVHRRLLDSIEAERLYLAQELHDGPIQELYGITFLLSGIWKPDLTEPGAAAELQEQLDSSSEMVKRVVDALRSICGELRPPALAPFGLEKAIHAHIEQVSKNHPDLAIYLDLAPDGQLIPERMRLALFRVYQHAVSNIIRHSQAKHMQINFSLNSEQVVLSIEDDGCGFELPARWIEFARGGHLGLVGTAERVRSIGGQLEIITARGKGTVIRVTAPIKMGEESYARNPSYTDSMEYPR